MKDTFDFDKIGKRMPYRTPDGFFDKMEEDVMNRLKEQDSLFNAKVTMKKPVCSYKLIVRSLASVAGGVAIIALVIGSVLKKKTSSSVVGTADLIQAFNQLDDADQLELLSTYQSDVFMDE